MSEITEVSSSKCFEGYQKVFSHFSNELKCKVNFGVYLPPEAVEKKKPLPVLYWLSGLTCTEQNFIQKSGFQRYAAAHNIIVVNPDTSPRDCNIEGENENWDFGTGAGFYVDATEEKWKTNYRMFSYVTKELPEIVKANFLVNGKQSVFGHSMGGHGALICALKTNLYSSVSAFAPICHPMEAPWGIKAFTGYLGSDKSKWAEWDACELIKKYKGPKLTILIHQGKNDPHLADGQLSLEAFEAVCDTANVTAVCHWREGYDHGYYFIATFIEEHFKYHASVLCRGRLFGATLQLSDFKMCEEDVLSISRKMERIISGQKPDDNALDMLKRLKGLPITLDILQKTRIGMTVNELRKKSERKEVQSEAKNLIRVWKKLLESKEGDNKSSRDRVGLPRNDSFTSTISDSQDAPDGGSSNGSTSASAKNGVGDTSKPKPQAATSRAPSSSGGGDDYRVSSRQLILKSLQGEPLDGSLDPEALAVRIEQCIFDQFRSTNDKYKGAIRSRVFNLRDKRNPELRENVLLGIVSPERLATMTAEEMASKEMKAVRSSYTKEAINNYQMATDTGTPTDMFKCGRCGKKNCTYTQAQTRSADEPMTTFVYCRECGNRWKFS